jgi:hypothetical protein
MLMRKTHILPVTFVLLLVFQCANFAQAQKKQAAQNFDFPDWKTNTEKRSINLKDLVTPDIPVPKDGIPAIDRPRFVSVNEAQKWLTDKEPIIVLQIKGISRAYPLQILVWHELVNDQIGGIPVIITYCSICNSAIVFDRRLGRRILTFGISGFVHGSNMVLYDRETESWWQQFTGEAIVGDLTGKKLNSLPAQIIGFAQFASAFPKGEVLSQQTGYTKDYGRNPHFRYDNIEGGPSHFRGKPDRRLRSMEKVIGVEIGDQTKAYPYALSSTRRVIYDQIGAREIVIFHAEGALSALDATDMKKSKEAGSTGVFAPFVDGQRLQFRYENGQFVDAETGSRWDILGRAVSGSLQGKTLTRIPHGDYFAFSWLAFKPKTEIYKE